MSCKICGLTASCKCHEPERILHAAVKSEPLLGRRIFFGKCHADCFFKGHNMGVKMSGKADDQGFLTNKGRYVTRSEAAKIAFEQGQILRPTGYLISEDLWHRHDNGRYDHDEIKGYVLREESK